VLSVTEPFDVELTVIAAYASCGGKSVKGKDKRIRIKKSLDE